MNNIIALHHVSKGFNGVDVLQDISFSLSPGSITCLMGPSGSGKTTLLRLMAGLLAPDQGQVQAPNQVSMVFQEDRLLPHLTAQANLRFVLGRGKDEEIYQILEELGLSDTAGKPVSDFSGGMARRVAIARALLADYQLLLLDEPFKGLDEDNRALACACILRHRQGRTLVLVAHDPSEAQLLGAEVIRMGGF